MLNLQECYDTLGIAPSPSAKAVRRAYLEKVKRWHPDSQWRSHYSEIEAQEQFLKIQAAYEYIMEHQEFSALPKTPSTSAAKPVSSTMFSKQGSERLYDNAVQLARQGLYRKAIAELSAAIRINPNDAICYKYRGSLRKYLGLHQDADADFSQARALEKQDRVITYPEPTKPESPPAKTPQRHLRSLFTNSLRLLSLTLIAGLLFGLLNIDLSPSSTPNDRRPIYIELPSSEL